MDLSHDFRNRRAVRTFSTIKYFTVDIISILNAGNTFCNGTSDNCTGNRYNDGDSDILFQRQFYDLYSYNESGCQWTLALAL